jgi:hypothetical protein
MNVARDRDGCFGYRGSQYRSRQRRCVVVHARMWAAVDGIDADAPVAEGHELEAAPAVCGRAPRDLRGEAPDRGASVRTRRFDRTDARHGLNEEAPAGGAGA